jgi:hypothetical protein
MVKKKAKQKSVNKFIYWTPRILSIIFVFFLFLFSLDIFEMGLNFWETLIALFIHNIPALILLAIVIVSWRCEIVGGIAFILAGLAYIVMLLRTILMNSPHEWYMLFWSVTISGPAFLIGILFLIGWFRKIKKTSR